MKIYLLFFILFSTFVIATPPRMPCESLENNPQFYEQIIQNSGIANSPEGWSISKILVNNCRSGNEIVVLVDYTSLPAYSKSDLSYKTQIRYVIEGVNIKNEKDIEAWFNKLPFPLGKFEEKPAVKLFLEVTGAKEVIVEKGYGNQEDSFTYVKVTNPDQKFGTKASGYQEDSITYLLEKGDLHSFVLITPQLIAQKDSFLQISTLPEVMEFEEKAGIGKIEMASGQVTLFEGKNCLYCLSTLTVKDTTILRHKLDYTKQWKSFPEINKGKEIVVNQLIPMYNPTCALHPDFNSLSEFVLLNDGTGWKVLFSLECQGTDRTYWKEINFNIYKDGRYNDFRVSQDEEALFKAQAKNNLSSGIFLTIGILGVILLIIFLIKRKNKNVQE